MGHNRHRLGGLAAYAILQLWRRRIGPRYSARTHTLCRFHPSCSRYAMLALTKHGLIRGTIMAVNRIRRCTPANTESCIDFP